VLRISRGSVHYLPRPVPDTDLAIMRRLDRLHLEFPFAGSRMLRRLLAAEGGAMPSTLVCSSRLQLHRIIRAILAGERDPQALVALRHYSCHSSAATIARALTGSYRTEHLFALEQALALYGAYRERYRPATCESKPC
jgi:hypothetical protein